MSDTRIPESTHPFSVYCQARAVVAMGREYPTSMCGNDPRLLFAAMVGVEDAIRFGHKETPYPTQEEFLQNLSKTFGDRFGFASDATDPLLMTLNVTRDQVSLSWDPEGDEEGRIVDVIIGGRFRPTRETWQKLINAGLPMCSWQEASEGWDQEATK